MRRSAHTPLHRNCRAAALLIALALAFLTASTIHAAEDDLLNNADLQPSPEELARATVMRRWPNAVNLELDDMAEKDDDDDADEPLSISPIGDAAETRDLALDDDADPKSDPKKDEPEEHHVCGCWTMSVRFVVEGRDFEALMDDDGVIKYVYEKMPLSEAQADVLVSARQKVPNSDVKYIERMQDETCAPQENFTIVGIGNKEVFFDTNNVFVKIEDAPDEDDEKKDLASFI